MLRKILLSSPALLCVESFWITVSVSSVVIGLFRLFASSWLSFGRSHLSRNLSLSPSLSNVLAFFFFFNRPLYCCGISCNRSSPISDCVYVDPLFSSWRRCLEAYWSCFSFQSTSSWIHWTLNCAFSVYVVSLCSGLRYFLPSIVSGLSLLFFLEFLCESAQLFIGKVSLLDRSVLL